ncbi:hypothetical protein F0562_005001 [Nyssa sinensis]|uniref:Uncharacterized protein n=1 Tax=Nyssa sinensis TaxID=561372 RepID=A0A5J5AKH8_9ASTE|nr:hypothetical protein F0562_005001 [Nyssa sinensis]
MEEAEKMVALKKAYADIILNTAKEAAARIMASERKALRFQQDLYVTKDEALRMLLRLKRMIDSKTAEAEITSLNRQRRIEELEAQLDEAEETILNLRSELKQAHDQLGKAKSNHIEPLKGPIEKQDGSFEKLTNSDPIISSPSDSGTKGVMTSEIKNTPSKQRIMDGKCCTSAKQTVPSKSDFEKFCVDNPDLASIIMKNKEPEQYKNGCTQRIRAFERNDVDDQHFVIKSEPTIIMNEQNIERCTVPSPKTRDVDGLEEVPIHSSTYGDQPVKVCKKRKRKLRYRKAKPKTSRFLPHQPKKPPQPCSVLSHSKTNSNADNDNVKSGDGACTLTYAKAENKNSMVNSLGLEEKMRQNKDQVLRFVRKRLRKRRKVKYRDTIDQLTRPCQPCSFLSGCKPTSVNSNVVPGEDLLNTESDARIKTDIDPVSGSINVTECTKAVRKSGLTENATDEATELIDEAVLVQERDALKNPSVSGCKLNVEMDKAENTNSMENSFGLEEKTQQNEDQVLRFVRRGLRKRRKVKYRDTIAASSCSLPDQLTRPCQPCSLLSRCKPTSVNFNVISGEDLLNTESDARIKTDIDPVSGSIDVTECTKAVRKSGLAENATDEATELIDEAVLVQECETLNSPSVSSCKLNVEMDKVALMDSDLNNAKTSEATNRAPSQTDSSRLLKYTFSRKRKKESLTNPDENTLLGKSTTKRRVCEKQNGPPEPQKSSLIDESSRDSRRLVQVARQVGDNFSPPPLRTLFQVCPELR